MNTRKSTDDWLDRQLNNVSVPTGLQSRLAAITEPSDDDLDEQIVQVQVPPGLTMRLMGIPHQVTQQHRWMQRRWQSTLAAAATLLMIVGTYAAAMVSLVAVAYGAPTQSRIQFSVRLLSQPREEVPEPFAQPEWLQAEEFPTDIPYEIPDSLPQVVLRPVEQAPPAPPQWYWSERHKFGWQQRVMPESWQKVTPLLVYADHKKFDQVGDLLEVPRELRRGMRPPLARGFDSLFLLKYKQHPVVFLGQAAPELRHWQLPLSSDTYTYFLLKSSLDRGELPPPRQVRTEDFLARLDHGLEQPLDEDLALTLRPGYSYFGAPQMPHLLQIGVQAREKAPMLRPACRLTVLVDCSQSMERGGRMEMVQSALGELLQSLAPGDQISLIRFQRDAKVLAENATADDVELLQEMLASLRPAGSTNLAAGLQAAYLVANDYPGDAALRHRVVLLTDGRYRLREGVLGQLLAAVEEAHTQEQISLSVIDLHDSQQADPCLSQLVHAGGGKAWHAESQAKLTAVLRQLLTGQSQRMAEDVRLKLHLNPQAVAAFRIMGHEASDGTLQGAELQVPLDAGQQASVLLELRLLPESDDPVAWAEIIWRDPFSGIERTVIKKLSREQFPDSWRHSSVFTQRAAVAAEMAEILRESVFARESSLEHVLRVAESLPAETIGYQAFQDLVEVLQQAAEAKP